MSRDPQINIRLPRDLKEDVHEMAAYNKRSVNAEIVAVLLDAVRKHKLNNQSQARSLKTSDKDGLILAKLSEKEKIAFANQLVDMIDVIYTKVHKQPKK